MPEVGAQNPKTLKFPSLLSRRAFFYINNFLLALFFNTKFSGDFLPFSITIILIILFISTNIEMLVLNAYPKITITPIYSTWVLFSLFYISSYLWTNAPTYGFSKIYLLYSIIIATSAWMGTWARRYQDFRWVYSVIYIMALIYFYATGGLQRIQEKLAHSYFRLDLTDGTNAIVIGTFFGFGLINLLSFLSFRKHHSRTFILNFFLLKNAALIIFSIFSIVMMFFTGSKGPLLAVLLSFLLYYGLTNIKIKTFLISTFFLLGFSVLLSSIDLESISENFFSKEVHTFVVNRFLDDEKSQSVSSRTELIDFTLKNFFLENPLKVIFGTGIGNYGYAYDGYDIRNYPHNIFFEFLFEFGIIGVSFFLYQIIYVVKLNYRFRHVQGELRWLLIGYYFFLIRAITTGDFPENFGLFIYFLLIITYENSILRPQKLRSRRY